MQDLKFGEVSSITLTPSYDPPHLLPLTMGNQFIVLGASVRKKI